jgi:hypothetical protein
MCRSDGKDGKDGKGRKELLILSKAKDLLDGLLETTE